MGDAAAAVCPPADTNARMPKFPFSAFSEERLFIRALSEERLSNGG
jgi:hypothetical protein